MAVSDTLGKPYERVLLVDDTILIRGDTPDVFELVPKEAMGGTVEGPELGRTAELSRSIVQDMCDWFGLPYNPLHANGVFLVNSGFLLFSSEDRHRQRFFDVVNVEELDLPLHMWGDQAYINAALNSNDVPFFDLGYAYNYVGSFETTRRGAVDIRAEEAFVVHATTGIGQGTRNEKESSDKREEFLRRIDMIWKEKGL